MRDWYKRTVFVENPVEGHPDCGREITLVLNCLDGYPAYTRGAPETCSPAEGPQFEILDAVYEDGSKVPREIVDAIGDDRIAKLMREPV